MRVVSLLLFAGMLFLLRGAAFASEGGGHGGGLNWWDFFLRLGNFVILLAVLIKLLKKPIAGFFSKRHEDIQSLLAELETKRREAEKKSAEYKAKLTALEDETKKIVSELIAEGEAEKAKIIAAAHAQAEYLKQQAQIAIQQEIKAAKESLRGEIAELSVAEAEKILREKLFADDQERLIREFMTKAVEAK
ncbi:MAG: F0F1 ATP synthase subunit B [Spirochaetaceae bacterium]|nr:F0F1 ATP synthase subunit B [Spirochaetaceae bacterium]